MPTAITRSDYDAIFARSGCEGLMQALHDRFGDTPALDRELARMGRSGKWTVEWDGDTGEGCIIARVDTGTT